MGKRLGVPLPVGALDKQFLLMPITRVGPGGCHDRNEDYEELADFKRKGRKSFSRKNKK